MKSNRENDNYDEEGRKCLSVDLDLMQKKKFKFKFKKKKNTQEFYSFFSGFDS